VAAKSIVIDEGAEPLESDAVIMQSDQNQPVQTENLSDKPHKQDAKPLGQERVRPKMYVKWSANTHRKRVFDKQHYCLYCNKANTNLSKHMLNKQKNEERIEEICMQDD